MTSGKRSIGRWTAPTSNSGAISSAILENYIKRLEKLESMAADFKGVEKVYAIQAGRELRVVVESEKLSDEDAIWLARDVAKKVEAELTYPGQIKVTVIRETRAVEYAR